jgi:hypothetical protein
MTTVATASGPGGGVLRKITPECLSGGAGHDVFTACPRLDLADPYDIVTALP